MLILELRATSCEYILCIVNRIDSLQIMLKLVARSLKLITQG